MRQVLLTMSLPFVALVLTSGCSKKPACETLAEKLCDSASDRCIEARGWLDAQGGGDAEARDASCQRVLDDATALAAYRDRFLAEMAPPPAPVTVQVAPGAAPRKPTTKDEIRNVGETIEEIGETGKKTGDALDKIEDALDRDRRK